MSGGEGHSPATCVIFRGAAGDGRPPNLPLKMHLDTCPEEQVGLCQRAWHLGASREQAFHFWPEHSRLKLEGSPGGGGGPPLFLYNVLF